MSQGLESLAVKWVTLRYRSYSIPKAIANLVKLPHLN
jgi:hypothetical protein